MKRWLFVVVACLLPVRVSAQEQKIVFQASIAAENPLDPFSLAHKAGAKSTGPVKARRGEAVKLVITGTPARGHYTYPLLKFTPEQNRIGQVARLKLTPPTGIVPLPGGDESQPEPDVFDGNPYFKHKKPFTWVQDVLVLPDAAPGAHLLPFKIDTQVCNDTSCTPIIESLQVTIDVSDEPAVPLTADLQKRWQEVAATVKKDSTPSKVSTPVQLPTAESPSANGIRASHEAYKDFMLNKLPPQIVKKTDIAIQSDSDLVGFILAGMFWGFVSLITPCVFPMIPITVSFFLKQSEKEHHQPVTMALVYCGTIIVVLTIAATFLLAAFRWLSINPIMNYAIGILFIYFALSLFGMYEIALPSGLARFTSEREGKGGYGGTVFMALTFTIISFACVAPFLGGFGGTAAGGQRPMWHNLVGGLAFSITFASPFFVLALFPAMLRKMPKSGSWLNTVKVVMGFLELAAALKFFRAAELVSTATPSFFTFDFVLGMYVALSILTGLYLLNIYRLPHDEPVEHLSVPRMILALLFITLGLHLMPALFKFNAEGETQRPRGTIYAWVESFLLPETRIGQGETKSGNLEHAIAQAREHRKRTGQPKRVFIDFTGRS